MLRVPPVQHPVVTPVVFAADASAQRLIGGTEGVHEIPPLP